MKTIRRSKTYPWGVRVFGKLHGTFRSKRYAEQYIRERKMQYLAVWETPFPAKYISIEKKEEGR